MQRAVETTGVILLAADKPPPVEAWPAGVVLAPPPMTVAQAEHVYHRGRSLAAAGGFTAPEALVPFYGREPEAVTLWNQRKASKPAS